MTLEEQRAQLAAAEQRLPHASGQAAEELRRWIAVWRDELANAERARQAPRERTV